LRTRWPDNAFPFAATFFTALGALGVAIGGFLLYVFAYFAAVRHGAASRADLPLAHQIAAQLAGYLCAYAYMLRAVPRVAMTGLPGLGVRFPTAREILTGVLGAGAMLFGVLVTGALVVKITHHEDAEAAMQLLKMVHTNGELGLFIFATVVAAPLVEEFGFRVFLYNALERYSNVPVAAVISSIVFGLVHGAGPSVVLPLAVGGFVLAAVYISTGNYFANVITHATFNLVVLTSAVGHPGH
jgi:membrane protease YdiL (CAAX protease family)